MRNLVVHITLILTFVYFCLWWSKNKIIVRETDRFVLLFSSPRLSGWRTRWSLAMTPSTDRLATWECVHWRSANHAVSTVECTPAGPRTIREWPLSHANWRSNVSLAHEALKAGAGSGGQALTSSLQNCRPHIQFYKELKWGSGRASKKRGYTNR